MLWQDGCHFQIVENKLEHCEPPLRLAREVRELREFRDSRVGAWDRQSNLNCCLLIFKDFDPSLECRRWNSKLSCRSGRTGNPASCLSQYLLDNLLARFGSQHPQPAVFHPGLPAGESPWKATTRQLKNIIRAQDDGPFNHVLQLNGCCQASRRTGADPRSSGRSIGCSCPLDWRSAARNTRCRIKMSSFRSRKGGNSMGNTFSGTRDRGGKSRSQRAASSRDSWRR